MKDLLQISLASEAYIKMTPWEFNKAFNLLKARSSEKGSLASFSLDIIIFYRHPERVV